MAITQDLILTGSGIAQLVYSDGSIVDITESQDISITSSATTATQEGGASLYSLLEFVTKLATKLTITNARYTLAGVKAVTGATQSTGASVWNKDVVTPLAGAFTLSKVTNVLPETAVAKVIETGEILTFITTGTPTATQFTVSALGVGKVDTTLSGNAITVSYYTTDATGESVQFLENTVPGNCELRFSLITEYMEDNKRYKIDIRAYRCKGSGSYSFDAKKSAAFSPKLEFNILNAGRLDGKVMEHNVSVYTG
jgi:hypothetical protein